MKKMKKVNRTADIVCSNRGVIDSWQSYEL